MYTIRQIEDAIIDALDPLKSSLAVRTIKSYQGEIGDLKEARRIIPLFPAIFIAYGGSTFTQNHTQVEEELLFIVFVADQNFRSEKDARRGGATGRAGTYAMLEGVRSIMLNHMLGLSILPLEIVSQESVLFGDGMSIYSAIYRTEQIYQEDYSGK